MSKRLLLLAAILAGAGCGGSLTAPDPTRPSSSAAALEYRSAFAGYLPFREEPIAPWRGANETVKDAAGHGGHR